MYGPQTADFIHRNYGGEQYYKSQSGRSGAGWIENRPYIVRCDTLRTDIGIPKPLGGKVLNDFNVIVPVNGDYDCSSHGIFLVKGERVWYVDQHQLLHSSFLKKVVTASEYLSSEEEEVSKTVSVYTEGWGDIERHDKKVMLMTDVPCRIGILSRTRILRHIFFGHLLEEMKIVGNIVDYDATTEWHRGLGLILGVDGKVYRKVGGLLIERLDSLNREDLQKRCHWVTFLKGSLDYLQHEYDDFSGRNFIRRINGETEEVSLLDVLDIFEGLPLNELESEEAEKMKSNIH